MPKKLAFDKHAAQGETKDLPIASLKCHGSNYRTHPEAQVQRIAESLSRNGQRKAVVVSAQTNEIIAGHGVVEAALQLGWDEVRCDVWTCTPEQAVAYLIDDNSLQNLAEDDEGVLAGLLLSLQETDYPPVSFDEKELQELLAAADTPGPFPQKEVPDEFPKEGLHKCPQCEYEWRE